MSCWMEALCLRPEPPIQDGSGASCLDEDDPYIEMTSANQVLYMSLASTIIMIILYPNTNPL